jgi:aspartyl protease family protein
MVEQRLAGLSFWGLSIAVLSGTVFPIQDRAVAQTCFMVTGSGRQMNLGKLCGDTPATAPSGQKTPNNGVVSAKIKRRISATPVIEVLFNGGRKFEMIVDTGASGTLITREMANALRVKPVGFVQAGIADGSVVRMSVGKVQSVAVNGLIARNLEVAIAEKMDIGLLGHDFFGNYDLKIKRDVIEFYPRQSN